MFRTRKQASRIEAAVGHAIATGTGPDAASSADKREHDWLASLGSLSDYSVVPKRPQHAYDNHSLIELHSPDDYQVAYTHLQRISGQAVGREQTSAISELRWAAGQQAAVAKHIGYRAVRHGLIIRGVELDGDSNITNINAGTLVDPQNPQSSVFKLEYASMVVAPRNGGLIDRGALQNMGYANVHHVGGLIMAHNLGGGWPIETPTAFNPSLAREYVIQ